MYQKRMNFHHRSAMLLLIKLFLYILVIFPCRYAGVPNRLYHVKALCFNFVLWYYCWNSHFQFWVINPKRKTNTCLIYWITCRHVGRWKIFPWFWDVRRLSRFTRWSFYEAILEMTGITCRQVWTTLHSAEIYRISCQNDFRTKHTGFPGNIETLCIQNIVRHHL